MKSDWVLKAKLCKAKPAYCTYRVNIHGGLATIFATVEGQTVSKSCCFNDKIEN